MKTGQLIIVRNTLTAFAFVVLLYGSCGEKMVHYQEPIAVSIAIILYAVGAYIWEGRTKK